MTNWNIFVAVVAVVVVVVVVVVAQCENVEWRGCFQRYHQ